MGKMYACQVWQMTFAQSDTNDGYDGNKILGDVMALNDQGKTDAKTIYISQHRCNGGLD